MILTRPFRKPIWLISSFIKKYQKIFFLAALIGACLFIFIKNFLPLILPKIKPTKRIGFVGQYTLNNLPSGLNNAISRGLTKINSEGLIEPDLAISWEINQEGTKYKFILDSAAFWSDGTQIKAQDLDLKIPETKINIIDDFTLEFELKEPYAPFLSLLSRPLFKNQKIGASVFTLKSIKYSGPYLKTLEIAGPTQNFIYRFYPSNESAWLGFRLGEIDQLNNLLINPVHQNSAWKDKIKVNEELNRSQYLAIIFNLADPYLSNKSFRQSLAYAIEKKAPNPEARALTPIRPDSWAFNPKVKPYEYNPVQAKELFEKFSTEATISGELEINLATSQTFLPLAESIALSWENTLGIKTKVKVVNNIEPNFQALLITQLIPLDPDQYALWHSTQSTNITHYSDLKIDKLLEDGRRISDLKKRKEIYLDFQRFLVEDLPAIFLQYPTSYTISRR